ncbi:MAG TPA: isoamylase early set domain-containing protein [Nitrospiraceae bacterium]|jgi:1,4-alpha-glucan branching enzyme|nr:isoamylase early set domain-containing protein [Nitrospiraceae bacterium]
MAHQFRALGLAFALGLVLTACAAPVSQQQRVGGEGVRFTVVAPSARSVAVAGDFNGWSPTTHPLKPAGCDGVWSGVVAIPEGEYRFMYVIDGKRWLTPPEAEDFVRDGFGNLNGVLVVP